MTMRKRAEEAKKRVADRHFRAQFAFSTDGEDKYKHAWIRDPQQAFVPARILEHLDDGKNVKVEVGVERKLKVVKKDDVGPSISRLGALQSHYDDMVKMEDVNEASILHNLRFRFHEDLIYTNIGTILVSINPFKWMDELYTTDQVTKHLNTTPGELQEPHVYTIASSAFHGVQYEQEDQSIVISGESGAGKTEATKKCLQFFAEAAACINGEDLSIGSSEEEEHRMERKLLSANPLLEAFGNAKTVRNNNSSRFGKWMEVHFDGRTSICGCRIINYLLEKSRVVSQAKDERNYHIFYQLLAGGGAERMRKYGLENDPMKYSFINGGGCATVDTINDQDEFNDLIDAADALQITKDQAESMFRLVAALLHVGNIKIERTNAEDARSDARIVPSATVANDMRWAAQLLGVEQDVLRDGLITKAIQSRDERLISPLTSSQANDSRKSLARSLYGRMFDWIVQRVNAAMNAGLGYSCNIIGVLDIFGFEIFEHNSFEQLCINYCNEKLQQHFNYHVFKAEEACYKSEEIDYDEVKYIDNQDVLDLIEGRHPNGILVMLDDELKVPAASDATFRSKLIKEHGSHARLKNLPRSSTDFGVNHYAGAVQYDTTGFLDKNRDEMALNLREMIYASKFDFIQLLFVDEIRNHNGDTNNTTRRSVAPKRVSQGGQFRKQLDNLMNTLNKTQPHYIRCIKPNDAKKANYFQEIMCLQQLQYAGVFEAVKIRQQGYPFRWTHEVFYKRYRHCAVSTVHRNQISSSISFKTACSELLEDLAQQSHVLRKCKLGRTMVLYRAEPHRILEMMRDTTRTMAVCTAQRVYRGHHGRKLFNKLQQVRVNLRDAMTQRTIKALELGISEAENVWFPLYELGSAKNMLSRLIEEKKVLEELENVMKCDPSDHYETYRTALKEARRLDLEQNPIFEKAFKKFKTVKQRMECKKRLARGVQFGDKRLIQSALDLAEELKPQWGDVVLPPQRQEAEQMLRLIEREEKALTGVRQALISHRLHGTVGRMNLSDVTVDEIDVALMQSSQAEVTTKAGQCLVKTARMIRRLRAAFITDSKASTTATMSEIELALKDLIFAKQGAELARESRTEVALALSEVRNRRLATFISSSLTEGAATGEIGQLDMQHVQFSHLEPIVEEWRLRRQQTSEQPNNHTRRERTTTIDVEEEEDETTHGYEIEFLCSLGISTDEIESHRVIQASSSENDPLGQSLSSMSVHAASEDVKQNDSESIATKSSRRDSGTSKKFSQTFPISDDVAQLYQAAELVLKLRRAMSAKDWLGIRRVLKECNDVTLPNQSQKEFQIAQLELDNHTIIHSLTEALQNGMAEGEVGDLDTSVIETTELEQRIHEAQEIGPTTKNASQLLEVAKLVLKVRRAMMNEDFDVLDDIVSNAKQVLHNPIIPSETNQELIVARYEAQNIKILDLLEESLTKGGPKGEVGQISYASIKTDHIANALAQADKLVCRTMEAKWLYEVAECMCEVRRVLHDKRFDELQTCILAVNALDNSTGAQVSPRSRGPSLGPSKGNRTMSIAPGSLNLSALRGGLKGLSSASGGMNLKSRRASTFFADAKMNKGLFSDETNRKKLLESIKEQSTLVSDANVISPTDRGVETKEQFKLPPCVRWEIQAIQHELDNHVILSTIREALEHHKGPQNDSSASKNRHIRIQSSNFGPSNSKNDNWSDSILLDPTGSLDVSHISTTELSDAVEKATSIVPRTDKARQYLATASAVLKLRTAVLESDWPLVRQILARCHNPHGVDESQEMELRALFPRSINYSSGYTPSKTSNMENHNPSHRKSVDPAESLKRDSLFGMNGVLGSNQIYICEEASAEIHRIQREADYLWMMDSLANSMRHDGVRGKIGQLDTSLVGTSELATAIDMARALAPETDDALFYVEMARVLWQLRNAVLDNDWTAVEGLVEAADALQDKMQHSTSFSLPKDCTQEIYLLREEVRNRKAIGALKNALYMGRPVGEIGRLNLAQIDTHPLEQAIKLALDLRVSTPESRCLIATAIHLRSARISLMGGSWERLTKLLAYSQSVIQRSVSRNRYALDDSGQQNLNMSKTASRPTPFSLNHTKETNEINQSSREGMHNTSSSNEIAAESKTTNDEPVSEGEMGSWKFVEENVIATTRAAEKVVESGVKVTHSTSDALKYDIWFDGLAADAVPELEVMQAELDNRNVIVELTKSLCDGAPTGSIGHIDVSSIEVSELDWSIDYAKKMGCITLEAQQMLHTAQLIRRLRQALASHNWLRLEQVLIEAQDKILADIVAPEVRLAQDELDNRAILLELAGALAQGKPSGETGGLFFGAVETKGLQQAIEFAEKLSCKTIEAKTMLSSAKVILRLRQLLSKSDYKGAAKELESLRGQAVATVAISEVRMYQDEVDNWVVVNLLTSVVTKHCVCGTVGNLDNSSVSAKQLERALSRVEEIGCRTEQALSLLTGAQCILQVRKAVLDCDWEIVREAIEESKKKRIAPECKPELELLENELDDRLIISLFTTALSSGGPSGEVGVLNTESIDLEFLDYALSTALEKTVKTQTAGRLLQAAQHIRRLRSVVHAQRWELVGRILREARSARDCFPLSALRELQLVQDEFDNRSLTQELRSALAIGGPAGNVGTIEIEGVVEIQHLDEALTFAKSLGCKTDEARLLYRTVQVIRRLRHALLSNDFPAIKQVLQEEVQTPVASEAEEEVDLIRGHVTNWSIMVRLRNALERDQPIILQESSESLNDILNDSKIDITRFAYLNSSYVHHKSLEDAIEYAISAGCVTTEAHRALHSAQTLVELRKVYTECHSNNDFTPLKELIAKIKGQQLGSVTLPTSTTLGAHSRMNHQLLPGTLQELRLYEYTIQVQQACHQLRQAIASKNQDILAEALAEADVLHLQEHNDPTVQQCVKETQSMLSRVRRTLRSLEDAIRSKSVSELVDAIALGVAIDLDKKSHSEYSSDEEPSALFARAQTCLERVRSLTDRASIAIERVDVDMLKSVSKEAHEFGFTSSLIDKVNELLKLPQSQLLRKQLTSAVKAGQTERILDLTIQLKDMFFDDLKHVSPHPFDIYNYPLLKGHSTHVSSPLNGVSMKQTPGKDSIDHPSKRFDRSPISTKVAETPKTANQTTKTPVQSSAMQLHSPHTTRKEFLFPSDQQKSLSWQNEPINTSFITLEDPHSRRFAVKLFRNILAFMGDRQSSRSLELGCETVELCLERKELRDETFLQMCKQLCENPSPASMARGWVLMQILLEHFPPSEQLENYLEYFLRQHEADKCVRSMHLSLYRGELNRIPTPSSILDALERANAPPLTHVFKLNIQKNNFSPSKLNEQQKQHDTSENNTNTVKRNNSTLASSNGISPMQVHVSTAQKTPIKPPGVDFMRSHMNKSDFQPESVQLSFSTHNSGDSNKTPPPPPPHPTFSINGHSTNV